LAFAGLNMWIAAVRAADAGPASGVLGRKGGQDWSHPFHSLGKAHVVIPLVLDFERLHSADDGVVWEGFEIGVPVRINTPVRLKVTALQSEERISRRTLFDFHAVMACAETDAFLHQFAEHLEPLGLRCRMPLAASAKHEHRIHPLEYRLVRRPIVRHYRDLEARRIGQALLKQKTASAVF